MDGEMDLHPGGTDGSSECSWTNQLVYAIHRWGADT